jgi:hypothetical protein
MSKKSWETKEATTAMSFDSVQSRTDALGDGIFGIGDRFFNALTVVPGQGVMEIANEIVSIDENFVVFQYNKKERKKVRGKNRFFPEHALQNGRRIQQRMYVLHVT